MWIECLADVVERALSIRLAAQPNSVSDESDGLMM